jgi:hypothetical protein
MEENIPAQERIRITEPYRRKHSPTKENIPAQERITKPCRRENSMKMEGDINNEDYHPLNVSQSTEETTPISTQAGTS